MLDIYLMKLAEKTQDRERQVRLSRDLGISAYSVEDLVKMAMVDGEPPLGAGGPPPGGMGGGIPGAPPPAASPVEMAPEDIGAAVGAALKAVKDKEDAVNQEAEAQAAQAQEIEMQAQGAMQPPPEQMPPTFPPGQEPQAPPPPMPPGQPPAANPAAGGPAAGGPAGPKPPAGPSMKTASGLRRRIVQELEKEAVGPSDPAKRYKWLKSMAVSARGKSQEARSPDAFGLPRNSAVAKKKGEQGLRFSQRADKQIDKLAKGALVIKEALQAPSLKTLGLVGLGAAPAAAGGAVIGSRKGKKKGQQQGLQVGYYIGTRKGFQAGARRGYTAAMQRVQSAGKKKQPVTKPSPKK